MPSRRGRARKGDRRIDAAMDHFAVMGYAARDVRAVVAHLLEVYGGPSAWPLLEDGSYQVVQEKLFEEEDEEKQKQDQPLLLEDRQVEELRPQHAQQHHITDHHQFLHREVDDQTMSHLKCKNEVWLSEPEKHLEEAVDEAPPKNKSILQVAEEVPAETESAHKEVEDPMFIVIEPHPLEATVPLTEALRTGGTMRPCYGWISESEDEEELTGQHHEVHVPSSGGDLVCKRKRVH